MQKQYSKQVVIANGRSDVVPIYNEAGEYDAEKTTIVFITHDIDEALFLSQRIYVMEARPGRIIEEIDADLGL